MTTSPQFVDGTRFPEEEVIRHLKQGTVVPFRKSSNGAWWLRILPSVQMQARRDPTIRTRDKNIRSRIAQDNNNWPLYLPSSVIGEAQLKRVLASGAYTIWRVDSGGCLWLKRADEGEWGGDV